MATAKRIAHSHMAALLVAATLVLTACGPASAPVGRQQVASTSTTYVATARTTLPATTTTTAPAQTTTTTTTPAALLPPGFDWQPTANGTDGRPIMWTATYSSGGSNMSLAFIDRRAMRLVLHASGAIAPETLPNVIAAFNGGFKLGGESGMLLGGAQSGAITGGMAAAVGYADGGFDIGQWGRDIPSAARAVEWARSNLRLLVDGGRPSPDAGNPAAWGAVVKSIGWRTARSALGVTSDGNLVWVAGMRILPATLADALVAAGAARAMQLDINPMWVAGFSFDAGQPSPLVPGQHRPASTYIAGWNRDFFTVERR